MKSKCKTVQIKYEDLKFPNPIYKYRDWGDKFHKSIIQDLQVYLSPASGFEDPFDCKNPTRYDLLKRDEIKKRHAELSKESNEGLSRIQRRKNASDFASSNPFKNKEYLKKLEGESFNEFDSTVGILSLTANPSNFEMWKKYSNNHKGFCIGFESKILFKFVGGGDVVKYRNELPKIMPYPRMCFEEQMLTQIFNKLDNWNFEEEYRAFRWSQIPYTRETRTKTLPSIAYKEIIFGSLMTEENINEIIKIARINIPHVEFKKSVIAENGLDISIIDFPI